jgi:hypothetical protein
MSIAPFALFLSFLLSGPVSGPFLLTAPAAKQEKIPGQKPLMIVGDAFQFTPGAWGAYEIRDSARNESYRMVIAIMEKEKKQKKGTTWMEIEVESKDNPTVVTRFLAEETPQGPGTLIEVVVQVQGYSPFKVPKKYFTGKNSQVGAPVSSQIVRRLEKKPFRIAGRTVLGWEVEAEDPKGNRTHAVVSEEVAPIGVIEAQTQEVKMSLLDWGTGARTRITGKPRGFTLWILEQMAKELGKQ